MDYKKKLKDALGDKLVPVEVQEWIEENFPELVESEDERMIQYFKDLAPFDKAEELYEKYGFSHEDAIAWLEKQGEHAKFRDSIQVGDKVTRNEDGVLVNLSQLNRVAKKDEKQGEKKPADKVELKFKVGDVVRSSNDTMLKIVGITDYCYNCVICATNDEYSFGFNIQDEFELVEQKPAEEYSFNIESELFHQLTPAQQGLWKKEIEQAYNAGVDKQKSTEWSEEDENNLDFVVRELRIIVDDIHFSPITEWLKSLRPQNRWRPSEEQIE